MKLLSSSTPQVVARGLLSFLNVNNVTHFSHLAALHGFKYTIPGGKSIRVHFTTEKDRSINLALVYHDRGKILGEIKFDRYDGYAALYFKSPMDIDGYGFFSKDDFGNGEYVKCVPAKIPAIKRELCRLSR